MKRIVLFALLPFFVFSAKAQSASYIKTDITTQGSWVGAYGADGHVLEAGAASPPGYLTFSVQNTAVWTWPSGGTESRDLQSGNTRLAACWYSPTSFYFDINATDGNAHQLSLYLLDWDDYQGGRDETVTFTNAASGAVMASQRFQNFVNGAYGVFTFSGHVHVNVTNNIPASNAVVSGLFFDTTQPVQPPGQPGQPTVTVTNPVPGVYNVNLSGAPGQKFSISLQTTQGVLDSSGAFAVPITVSFGHAVVLGWNASSSQGVTGYNVYRSQSSAGPFTLAGSTSGTSFQDGNVVSGQTYYYYLTALIGVLEGPNSPQISTTVPSP